ncbi:hypothetical protein [Agreia pratensis]|uniref:Uncharacterized protein n=1 Tax=Agreia pratensis TaxID=150121 RepID=A0A1X7L8B7_9MICO|nr:hypothetical protein [Agreia pratensis]SMG49990.1 hypothetical protein SAMN06296010_3468 [Agreia pratensis]
MSRARRIVAASALLVITLLGLIVVATQIPEIYYLPPVDDGYASKHVAVFMPAMVGTVVVAIAALALLVHLVAVIRRPMPRWCWVVAVALAIITVVAAVLVSTADHPVY